MTEIFFNNYKLDLGTSVVTENRQINSFFDLKDRQTNYTNKFNLPETPRNRIAMEMFGAIGETSDIPQKINNVNVFRNGIPTIQNGKGIVKKRKYGKGYDLNIQFGNYSIYDAIENKDLSDLDFSSINHTFTRDTIVNSWNNTWENGYIYTIGDFGFVNSNNNGSPIDARYQVPSVFFKWIWDKIFEESGYTYTYDGDINIFEIEDFTTRVHTITNPKENILGQVTNFKDLLSGISQKSFIKSVIQDFGLMMDKEDLSSEYRFILVQEFLSFDQPTVDLSRKFNSASSVDANLKGYAKENVLKYNYDNSEDEFSDGVFEVNNETLKDRKTMFTSPFKVPEQSSINVNSYNLFTFSHFNATRNDDGTIKEVKSKKTKAYVHNTVRASGQIRYDFDDGSQKTVLTNAAYAAFVGLTYSEIISKWYSNFVNLLQKPRLYEATMTFNSIDLIQFDFFKQVYIKQLGAYFYMNKIKGFKPGKVTKCELIKINKPDKLGEFSDDFNEDFNI
ncbi:hypothetical protein [Aquimarina algiphila]|uniref:Uncharacterized protein n=1 Tax=Aquimarina algiphila TaxID=2047982 RepID=A0A554VE18_9FLAO|nr:hypothetical protein [Aquimarina algiphila]TSE05248.1 hypothetical protein FOF46_23580 [Aquimarina algiphila]